MRLLLLPLLSLLPCISAQPTTYLTAPALTTTPQNTTTIQCWRLAVPFSPSTRPGIIGAKTLSVANVTDLSYIITPPRFNGGLHNAPVAQVVHVLSGLAHITLPQDAAKELWLIGGKGGLLFAADTEGLGHVTVYPSDQETVTFVTPFEGGVVPRHEVVKEGGCEGGSTWI